ncbi:hypothetical protein [Sphingobacterium multivorum]|uniref:hypothetical protein n=1 Tax=Sphingobacterium multivorum TaxID=28454 RepID=UPI003DA39C2E
MENQIKVGQSCEVAVITDNSKYPSLYNVGNTGVLINEYPSGNAEIRVGVNDSDGYGSWHAYKGCFKKVGKLTIKSLK